MLNKHKNTRTPSDRYAFETVLWQQGFQTIMGLDEVGRGCLAGPVVAAGVVLKQDAPVRAYRDSKTIPAKERVLLAEQIKDEALFWTIAEVSVEEIDRINILQASMKAMQICVENMSEQPDYLLVDGNRFPAGLIPHQCLVKGDDRSASIGAASILAKVYRDELMQTLHKEFPEYGWDKNVGYATQKHRDAIATTGLCKWHRKSFKLKS